MFAYNHPFCIRIVVLLLFFSASSCQLSRFVFYNFADVNDYKKFPSRPLKANPGGFSFHTTAHGRFPKMLNGIPFDRFLEENKTLSFLIIRRDSLLYEQYFRGYNQESIVPSFSMAKSVTSILTGCAIDDGLIKSVEEPITTYIPELSQKGFDKVKILHLLQMTSGINFNESYFNPFGHAASFYYGLNLRKSVAKLNLEVEPGKRFEYVSGNTQLLGLVLERALKGKTITDYLQEKIWTPLGMEYDASWSIDRKNNGLEKTFCCLNARARDFARIGRLYKNKGNWNGRQIVSQKWVEESTKADSTSSANLYQYQWWLPTPGQDFLAEGLMGQYIYVHPAKDLIIVRLGKNEGKTDWWSVFMAMAEGY